jgi:hypothetical protein
VVDVCCTGAAADAAGFAEAGVELEVWAQATAVIARQAEARSLIFMDMAI